MKERLDREREAFLQRESEQLQSERDPLTGLHKLDSYEAVQKRLELRDMEDEYLVDDRDAIDGEVTDSDAEFEAIVEMDNLIRELNETYNQNVREEALVHEYQQKMLNLMRKMHSVMELLEFENSDLWRIFDEVIASELFDFANLEWVVEMARLGYEMELPYQAFWGAMVNIALLKHQEF